MNCALIYTGKDGRGFHAYQCARCGKRCALRNYEPGEGVSMTCLSGAGSAAPSDGVGTELEKLVRELGGRKTACGMCAAIRDQMNRDGPEGVKSKRALYARHLENASNEAGWAAKVRAAAAVAVNPELAWRLSATDPYGSMVDESVRRYLSRSRAPS